MQTNRTMTSSVSKYCPSCEQTKAHNAFPASKHYYDGFHWQCKACDRLRQIRRDYELRERSRESGLLLWMNQIKEHYGCQSCGEIDTVCIDFHHIDPNEKEYVLTKLTYSPSGLSRIKTWERVRDELLKCCCLCANCHRKVHAGKVESVLKPISTNVIDQYFDWDKAIEVAQRRLSSDQVKSIRAADLSKRGSQKALMIQYGISRDTVVRIRAFRTYRDIA